MSTYFVDHNTMTSWEDPRIHIYQLEPFTQFQRKITYLHHKVVRQAKVPGNFAIKIRRSHVVEDSFVFFFEQPETELKKQPLVIFEGGSSEGDIRYFSLPSLTRQQKRSSMYNCNQGMVFEKLLDTMLGLFELDSASKVKIRTDATYATHLRYFKFVGRLPDLAIIHGILVDPQVRQYILPNGDITDGQDERSRSHRLCSQRHLAYM